MYQARPEHQAYYDAIDKAISEYIETLINDPVTPTAPTDAMWLAQQRSMVIATEVRRKAMAERGVKVK